MVTFYKYEIIWRIAQFVWSIWGPDFAIIPSANESLGITKCWMPYKKFKHNTNSQNLDLNTQSELILLHEDIEFKANEVCWELAEVHLAASPWLFYHISTVPPLKHPLLLVLYTNSEALHAQKFIRLMQVVRWTTPKQCCYL